MYNKFSWSVKCIVRHLTNKYEKQGMLMFQFILENYQVVPVANASVHPGPLSSCPWSMFWFILDHYQVVPVVNDGPIFFFRFGLGV